LRLETGQYHLAALRFYQRQGYRCCEAFAPYTEDPLSVFMMKKTGKQQ
jgi:putative acetyltransferase